MGKPLARRTHRTTLPQSALAGCQLPQRGSREWLVPFNRVLAEIRGCGRFSSPLRNSECFTFHHSTNDTPSVSPCGLTAPSVREPGWLVPFNWVLANTRGFGRFSSPLRNSKDFGLYHSTDDTPSVSHSLDSSLREGAGNGLMPFNRVLANIRGWRAIFIAPTKTQKSFPFTIQRRTLPQSRIRSTAPSGREPGMGGCHSLGGYGMILFRFRYRSSSEKMQPQYFWI